jgi:hypothetical protein
MTGNHGKDTREPVVPDHVEICMADPAIGDFDKYIVRSDGSSFEGPWREFSADFQSGVSFGSDHVISFDKPKVTGGGEGKLMDSK